MIVSTRLRKKDLWADRNSWWDFATKTTADGCGEIA